MTCNACVRYQLTVCGTYFLVVFGHYFSGKRKVSRVLATSSE